jgi:hypothetical protein
MSYSNPGLKFKTYTKKDPEFHFSPDNIMLVPRASFQLSDQCPREYKLIIAECIGNGWLMPVAHQPVYEQFMEELTK